jgi:hypothetical protein
MQFMSSRGLLYGELQTAKITVRKKSESEIPLCVLLMKAFTRQIKMFDSRVGTFEEKR